ncbi:transmembrane protein 132C isoform X2 [Cimex lectularius]|uniref:Transmembrane protein 132E n=1 Tax=Cimex lectularius TaxID=79782 RepID=A0A8I6SEK9_CIMLE|nr:transmembrane protein 132C isoform X2 [Cimex lectularius]
MELWLVINLLSIVWGVGCSVDVVLESPEGGYFLKQSLTRAQPPEPPVPGPPGAVLTTERFAVFQTSRPLAVRASYGPFSTKQTVPARSLVAEPSSNTSDLSWGRHLDLSAHLVTKTVERDWPVVRVVMHTGAEPGAQRVCAVVHATMGESRVSGACSPDSHEGMCLVELVLPWSWWPPLPARRAKPTKTPPRLVTLAYTVVEPVRGPQCTPKVMIQSLTPLGTVQLVPASQAYNTISTDNHVTMLMPQRHLYPTSKIHVPTYVTIKPPAHVTGFMLRARVKSGLKVLGAELISREDWNMTVEINTKQSVATVTVINKQQQQDIVPRTEEVFVWIIEVAGGGLTGLWQEGKLVWSVRYLNERGHPSTNPHHHGKHKASVRIHINKDDIHALIPISKNWEVVNSAVLTGKQVSQGMKVVMVSHGGHLADVTLQATCHVPDDSVIKVSSSCSSVYVDGSEVRGSANASVVVSYGSLVALASFTVWMPELPVEVSLPDTRLSQVKGWRVPDTRSGKMKRSLRTDTSLSMLTEDNNLEKPTACRLRYQQTDVEVYARFVAADHDSGRVSYLVNRRTWLRVTQLVLGLLRVSDTRIATLQGNILQGRAPGRTELQVVSAVSGRVLGAKEVRVLSDKVTITKLSASVVSGLQLAISPDTGVDNGYIAQASVTRKLTAQYQEGLLDMELVFSDGSTTSVSSIEREDYHLMVETERPDIVAFAPQTPMSQPRVIAVAQGKGNLLTVTMHPPTSCGSKVPLSSTRAHVDIDFSLGLSVTRTELVQNDGGANREIVADLHDLIGIPLKDEHNHEPTVQARQHHGSGGTSTGVTVSKNHILTPLEIGMYVLLAAFCFAIVVFVVSCIVYASKFKAADGIGQDLHHQSAHQQNQQQRRQPPTQNAHDWVWLGRSTLHVTDNPMFQGNSFHNPNHFEHSHHHQWESNNERMMDRKEVVPPVPPHGPGVLEDYRPPVPPHRKPMVVKHHHHHKGRGRKRATVVGNPMFNDNETGLALEELNLGMDYNQIMQYFDNLKESNA